MKRGCRCATQIPDKCEQNLHILEIFEIFREFVFDCYWSFALLEALKILLKKMNFEFLKDNRRLPLFFIRPIPFPMRRSGGIDSGGVEGGSGGGIRVTWNQLHLTAELL
jgi:hypothetical protein